MKPLRIRLEEMCALTRVSWEILEQDYVLSWILAGISWTPALKEVLVFKGGTALKKCYFGDYRFSQDLDFTLRDQNFPSDALLPLMTTACQKAEQVLNEKGEGVTFSCFPYQEKRPHPHEQKAFVIRAKLPWHRSFGTQVMIDVTRQEILCQEPVMRSIILEDAVLADLVETSIAVYSLEEIVAEKIRALLQFSKKLHERGWGRSRVRDYYDVWRVLKDYGHRVNLSNIPSLVRQKCAIKDMPFQSFADLFQEKLMVHVEQEWNIWLENIVVDIPDKKQDLSSTIVFSCVGP